MVFYVFTVCVRLYLKISSKANKASVLQRVFLSQTAVIARGVHTAGGHRAERAPVPWLRWPCLEREREI